MSLANEYTDNFFMDESSILDAHLRPLFRAFHYETPCINTIGFNVEKSESRSRCHVHPPLFMFTFKQGVLLINLKSTLHANYFLEFLTHTK